MTVPLHERIRAGIEARILSGALPPGARLPTEHALMHSHGCSRMTVNKALSALGAAGLIDRRKRAGTFVARPRVQAMVLAIPDLAQEVRSRGQHYRYHLLRRATGPGARLAPWGESFARALLLEGVHLADDQPLAAELRLIDLRVMPGAAAESFADEAPGSWLLRHVPWTEAETRIGAVGADAATARVLGVAAGEACLRVDRRTWRGPDHVTAVRQTFVGTAYDLVARFGPGATASGAPA